MLQSEVNSTEVGGVLETLCKIISCSPNLVNHQVLVESMDCQLAHIGLYASQDRTEDCDFWRCADRVYGRHNGSLGCRLPTSVHCMASLHSKFSLSSKAPKKSKGSNLIAKLMGLEEIPSQAAQKISSQRIAMFDIDMPKARKPLSSAAHKVDIEERKLNKIVETMQSKGLLKSNRAEEFWIQSHHSIISNSKRSIDGDAPPIVIMKPLPFSSDMFRRFKIKGEDTAVNRLSKVGDKSSKEVQSKPEETAAKTHYRPSSNKLKASVTVNQQQKKEPIEKKVDRVYLGFRELKDAMV
ncbi:hypothetical protein U1Q18_025278 [Sarracenia purpurea var. burkii]